MKKVPKIFVYQVKWKNNQRKKCKCKEDQVGSVMVSNIRWDLINQTLTKFTFNSIQFEFCKQARCIADVKADTDHTSFLTGTLSLKEENEVGVSFLC